MTDWVTSDIHFSHGKLLNYHPRTHFTDINEMNETIISNINSLVEVNDTLYILGDVAFDTSEHTVDYLTRINCKKRLVPGNHDNRFLKSKKLQDSLSDCRLEVLPLYYELQHKLGLVCLMHYPIESWNKMKHGSFMLHGHLHGSTRVKQGRIADVGMDTNELFPYHLESLLGGLAWHWPVSDIKGHHD